MRLYPAVALGFELLRGGLEDGTLVKCNDGIFSWFSNLGLGSNRSKGPTVIAQGQPKPVFGRKKVLVDIGTQLGQLRALVKPVSTDAEGCTHGDLVNQRRIKHDTKAVHHRTSVCMVDGRVVDSIFEQEVKLDLFSL